jgi:hypothetical protein
MAFVEEVFENMGKWYGGHTGHEYEKSETEEKGACRWSKPCYGAPGELTLEIDKNGEPAPHGNGAGKKFSY